MSDPATATRSVEPDPSLSPWVVFALWSIPALLATFETTTVARVSGHPIALWRGFVSEAPQWYGWALLTPVVARLGARFPLTRPVRLGHVAIHAAASLAASAAIAFGGVAIYLAVRPSSRTLLAGFRNWFLGELPAAVVAYFAILGVGALLRARARLREREIEASRLTAELRTAQLATLRMQLQPHFLFNSLNAIMALVRDAETAQAVHALSLLGDVLRATIDAGEMHEVTLAAEVDFVRRYLELEHVRFGDRLRVDIRVPESLLEARVPVFVLQPFVENALKHGVLRERAGNTITIGASAANGRLTLSVLDDGRGLHRDGAAPGTGIANTRARLAHMYGSAASLSVANGADGRGVAVEITLPWTTSS
ncbi:MAG TPA: histidine kinase [Gemmatimonadaceae bacterium]